VTPLVLALMIAQAPATEVDPIRCWWRTSHGAVAVGQPFTVALTCAVVETDAVRVVPDESPLAVGTVQLAPFELVSGVHPADLRSGPRRFFQYEYTVRLIEPTAIGRDVKLPDLTIHYRVESRVQAGSLEGRDRRYLLPPASVHVTSMVPADATDIRDASDVPFGAIDSLRFRARAFNIAAIALAALGVVVLVPAAMRVIFGATQRATQDATALSDRAILGGVAAELAAVQAEAKGGWSPELAARAAMPVRIVAGYALGRSPRQRPLQPGAAGASGAPGAPGAAGRLVVTRRGFKPRRIAVTSPVTTQEIADALERLPLTTPHERRMLLERLRDALAALTRSLYSAEPAHGDLDEAVATGLSAVDQVRRRRV
jgi:hypothetical protein